jgi:hypothetical protein
MYADCGNCWLESLTAGKNRYVAGRKQSHEVKVAAMEKLDGWDAFIQTA